MDILGTLYDWEHRILTGQPSMGTLSQSGLSPDQIEKLWPTRSIPTTVLDIVSGDPTGTQRELSTSFALPKLNWSSITFAGLLVAGVVLLYYGVNSATKLVWKKRK